MFVGDTGIVQLDRFRDALCAWLEENTGRLEPLIPGITLAEEVRRSRHNQQQLYEAGWSRYGWDELVGGLGGSPLMRAVVAEEAMIRDLLHGSSFAITEVVLPSLVTAAPHLARQYGPGLLRGVEGWCQGFSEPDAGSDLASLRCRAIDRGDHWVVTGQKIWTSYAQFAQRILLLTRTGTPESRHRGITAMLVDLDTPGISVRPLQAMSDRPEFSEIFFDGVAVPKERLVGELDGGWGVAMNMLRSERGGIFWMLSASLLSRLASLVREAPPGPADDELIGHCFLSIAALRTRSWSTQHRIAEDSMTTPETSIDKILMSTAEQELFDVALRLLGGRIEFSSDPDADRWRSGYFYSRAASIYGGTAEIQRTIVADQLLGLPRSR